MPGAHSSFDEPKIDRYAAGRLLAPRFLNNIIQGLIWTNGRGVTEDWGTDTNAAEIRIIKHKELTSHARTMGPIGEENRGHFNSKDPEEPESEEYGIKLVYTFDPNIDVATVLDDMIKLNALNATAASIERRVRALINGFTLAYFIAEGWNWAHNNNDENIVKYDPSSDSMYEKLMEAHKLLDKGDIDNYISTFPLEGRISVFNTEGKHEILSTDKTVYQAGSSRAVELMEIGSGGTMNREAVNTDVNGWFGELNQTPMHMMSDHIVDIAEEFLDEEGNLEGDEEIYAVLTSSIAAGRVFATGNSVKIIDSPRGQGLRLQPLFRWGMEVFYPKGVVFIVNDDWDQGELDTDAGDLEVIGKDSRS